MKQINVIGSIMGYSGYAAHTRGLLGGLIQNRANVRLQDENLGQGWETAVTSEEKDAIQKPMAKASERLDIFINFPHCNVPYLANTENFAQFVIWEGTSIPKFWLKYLIDSRIKFIFVASNHTKEAIENTTKDKAILDKIRLIPHGCETRLFKPGIKTDEIVTFIADKGWANGLNDRGGLQWVIKAFAEEFNKGEARLLVKLNKCYNQGFDVAKAIAELNITKPDAERPEVFITDAFISTQQLVAEIYNQGDFFVTGTMGEAFNLPCIQALACGLPVIATNFGGQTDFVNDNNGFLVDYELIKPFDIMYEETQWGKPKLQHLKDKFRRAYNLIKKDKAGYMKMREEAIKTSQKYTWKDTGNKILALIDG
jgi:glycosyltransferase involved in cell wall biosynthesis